MGLGSNYSKTILTIQSSAASSTNLLVPDHVQIMGRLVDNKVGQSAFSNATGSNCIVYYVMRI